MFEQKMSEVAARQEKRREMMSSMFYELKPERNRIYRRNTLGLENSSNRRRGSSGDREKDGGTDERGSESEERVVRDKRNLSNRIKDNQQLPARHRYNQTKESLQSRYFPHSDQDHPTSASPPSRQNLPHVILPTTRDKQSFSNLINSNFKKGSIKYANTSSKLFSLPRQSYIKPQPQRQLSDSFNNFLRRNNSTSSKQPHNSRVHPQDPLPPRKKSMGMRNSMATSRLMIPDGGQKQHIVSIIEYLSNEVGIAVFNLTTGEISLSQIVERLTYTKTVSTLYRFYPQKIYYSVTQENSILMQKLESTFQETHFEGIKRFMYDETKGFKLYSTKLSKEEINTNPDSKFVAYAALNALIIMIQKKHQLDLQYSTLPIEWHHPQDTLIIQLQTLVDLQVFFNSQTKKKQQSFIQQFKCLTKGGTRMLRANILQPLYLLPLILQRQSLVQTLLSTPSLYQLLKQQLSKLRQFQTVSIKFIHNSEKITNYRILKTYISSIVNLYNAVNTIITLYHKLINVDYEHIDNSIFQKLLKKIEDPRIMEIKNQIYSILDSERLMKYESLRSNKARIDTLVFLIREEALRSNFISICRTTYSRSVQDIHKLFESDKYKSGIPISLIYVERTGYSYSVKNISQRSIRESFGATEILQVYRFKNTITFITKELVSLNNKLKENENMILEECMSVIHGIVKYVQKRINALFEVNYQISTVDMILSFATYVKNNRGVGFCRPTFGEKFDVVGYKELVPVWFKESGMHGVGREFVMTEAQNIVFYKREYHSSSDLIGLVSLGFLVILSQIGAYVPCSSFSTTLFRFFMSKLNIEESIENKLSHFQTEVNVLNTVINTLSDNQQGSTLILMNEVIKGTNQMEQLAIGLGFIERIQGMNGFVVGVSADEAFLKYLQEFFAAARVINSSSSSTRDQRGTVNNNIQMLLSKLQYPQYLISKLKQYNPSPTPSLQPYPEPHTLLHTNNKNLSDNLNLYIELKSTPPTPSHSRLLPQLQTLFQTIL